VFKKIFHSTQAVIMAYSQPLKQENVTHVSVTFFTRYMLLKL